MDDAVDRTTSTCSSKGVKRRFLPGFSNVEECDIELEDEVTHEKLKKTVYIAWHCRQKKKKKKKW
jgi:hypothetical protein